LTREQSVQYYLCLGYILVDQVFDLYLPFHWIANDAVNHFTLSKRDIKLLCSWWEWSMFANIGRISIGKLQVNQLRFHLLHQHFVFCVKLKYFIHLITALLHTMQFSYHNYRLIFSYHFQFPLRKLCLKIAKSFYNPEDLGKKYIFT
jgi:hypothetical protein